jgi:hypothetical protein
MFNWYQQSNDMMKNWMDMQQQMMNGMMQTAGNPQTTSESYEQALQGWENAFKNAMETQALMTRMWARNMTAGMSSETSETFTKSVEQMTNTWTEMQSMMLSNWFTVMRMMNPANMQDQSSAAMQQWQESMGQMMQMQMEMSQKWMEMMSSAGDTK